MIINLYEGKINEPTPNKLIIRPIYRLWRQLPSGSWSNNTTDILNNTEYTMNLTQKRAMQNCISGYSQTISYYTFVVQFDNGIEKNLMDFIQSNDTISIEATGRRNNIGGSWYNSYFVDSWPTEINDYSYTAGSTAATVIKTVTFNKQHFNNSITIQDGTVLQGLNFYVSTGRPSSAVSGGIWLEMIWTSCYINGTYIPIQLEDWPS